MITLLIFIWIVMAVYVTGLMYEEDDDVVLFLMKLTGCLLMWPYLLGMYRKHG